MIRFQCDKCDRAIEAEDAEAGRKVECPECGDVNRVPGRSQGGVPDDGDGNLRGKKIKDRAEELGLPADNGPEQFVMTVRQSMFRARPFSAFFLFLGLLGTFIGGIVWTLIVVTMAAGIACWVGFGVLLVVLFVWWLKSLMVRLHITTKRTVAKHGLFSRSTNEVLHDRIQNIQVEQTLVQRLFGVGRLGISSSGEADVEIDVRDIPNPLEVRRIIDAYRSM